MTSSHEKRQARRAELVRRLTELAPRHRVDAMMEEVDGRALVRSLPAEEVYSTIIDVGLADCTEIVQLATPEQFRTFVDLAAWQRDRMDPLEVLHWLRAARGDDDESFIHKVQGLDIEVVELIYKRLALIHDLEENPDVDVEGVTMETPDNKFLVEFNIEGVDEAALRRLTFDIMAHNPFELTRFLEAVRWEQTMELEETAFQFRQARLMDLGFPELDEAMRIFAWVDPDKLQAPAVAASQALAAGTRVDFVGAAFKGLDAVERQNLEGEVRYLVNCALVAEFAEPGDPAAIRSYSEQARDYLDLGLEHLTGGDPERSAEVVRERTLRQIFQVGFSITLKLKRATEKLQAEPGSRFGETWLALDEETQAVQALLRRRPLKALKVPGAEPVPFRSRREVAESEALLVRVRGQRAVLQGLLGSSPAEVVARFGTSFAELTPQRLFLAVVAKAEIDGVIDVAPFPAMRLQELGMRLLEEVGPAARLRESAGKKALGLLEGRLPEISSELKPMIDRVLAWFAADVGAAWARDGRLEAGKLLTLPVTGELPV
jgi:hypothetical protein